MFYWSYENFKIVEMEFDTQIKECRSFSPIQDNNLEHGFFSLVDGRNFYILEGMLGFDVFEVSRPISEENTLFFPDEMGGVKLLDRKSLSPLLLKHVMDLPIENYSDVIPRLIHEADAKRPNHKIVIGHNPEVEEGMVCVQEYHDGFRTVWLSQETIDSPIVIDEDYYSLDLPEELQSFCDYIDESRDEIEEIGINTPRTTFISSEYVNFVYKDRYYQMLPKAFELHPEIFDCILDGVVKQLIEMGSPYVKTFKHENW